MISMTSMSMKKNFRRGRTFKRRREVKGGKGVFRRGIKRRPKIGKNMK
jgi:hypothetical protein